MCFDYSFYVFCDRIGRVFGVDWVECWRVDDFWMCIS